MQGNGFPRKNDQSAQLSRLSSILNGLDHGASALTQKAKEAMIAVRAGTYSVQAIQLSQRIIGECLSSASNAT